MCKNYLLCFFSSDQLFNLMWTAQKQTRRAALHLICTTHLVKKNGKSKQAPFRGSLWRFMVLPLPVCKKTKNKNKKFIMDGIQLVAMNALTLP